MLPAPINPMVCGVMEPIFSELSVGRLEDDTNGRIRTGRGAPWLTPDRKRRARQFSWLSGLVCALSAVILELKPGLIEVAAFLFSGDPHGYR